MEKFKWYKPFQGLKKKKKTVKGYLHFCHHKINVCTALHIQFTVPTCSMSIDKEKRKLIIEIILIVSSVKLYKTCI